MGYDGGHDIVVVNDVLYRILKKFQQGAKSTEISAGFWKRIGLGEKHGEHTCVIRNKNMNYTSIDDCPHSIGDVLSQITDYMWNVSQSSSLKTDERFVREMIQYLEENEGSIYRGYQFVKWEYYYPSDIGSGCEIFEYIDGKAKYNKEGQKRFASKSSYSGLEDLRLKNLRYEFKARKRKTLLQDKMAADNGAPNAETIHVEMDGIWIDLHAKIDDGLASINGRALKDYAFISSHDSNYYFIDASKLTISRELEQYNDGTFAYVSNEVESLVDLRPLPEALRILWSFISRYGAVKKECMLDRDIYQRLYEKRKKAGWIGLPSNDPEFMEAKKAACDFLTTEEAVVIFLDFINSITAMNTASIGKCIQRMPRKKDGLLIKNRVAQFCELGLGITDHEFSICQGIAYEFKAYSNTEFTSRLLLPFGVSYPRDNKTESYNLIKEIIEGIDI